jgi:hypothetical protein
MRLAIAVHPVLPSVDLHVVGIPKGPPLTRQGIDFVAQYPAYTFPCQRFVVALTGGSA